MGNTQQTGVKEDDHHGGSGSGSRLSVFLDQVLAGVAENPLAGGHGFEATSMSALEKRRETSKRESNLYYTGKSSSHGFSMAELVQNYDVLDKCTKDILSIIKPTEDDQNKRLHAIQEIVDSIYSVDRLGDAAVKPFGSFLSKLYAKSSDLDVSVELPNVPGFPTSKESLLGELMGVLKKRGVARDVNFIRTARVPVLQYVSKHFGISCDISINNYPGRIKSKLLYWINTLDGRYGDMVLLVKEWAKAQNINDPKDGTLNSYSLCLLVLFHFQTCEPAILPPMNEFLDEDISAESGPYNEKNLDEMCAESIAKFRRRDIGQRNQSSLSHLLATFFERFFHLGAHSSDHVISTYTGQLQRKQGGLYGTTKSCYLFVEDPFQRLDDAARTVDVLGLRDISTAFKNAKNMISSDGPVDRNEFLSLLCTPEVGSKLGARATADRYATPATTLQEDRFTGFLEQGPTLAAGDVKDGGGMSMTDKNKNTNYAALAGTVAGLGALGAGLYLMSKPKKTEEVVDD